MPDTQLRLYVIDGLFDRADLVVLARDPHGLRDLVRRRYIKDTVVFLQVVGADLAVLTSTEQDISLLGVPIYKSC